MMWVQVCIGAFRWWMLTQPLAVELRYVDALRYHAISVLFNQALPSTLGGDAVRLALMVREKHPAIASVDLAFTVFVESTEFVEFAGLISGSRLRP